MKVLITGAAGFIGSQLTHKLWTMDYELILIDNFSYGREDNLVFEDCDFRKKVVKMDIRDEDGMKNIFMGGDIDYVYNNAGIAPLPDCQFKPQEAIDVNVIGFVNILENARKYGVKKIIQSSTNAIYENAINFPTNEKECSKPTLIYPNTKYAAECFASSYCETYGMNISCLRFSNVYGPNVDCLRKQPPFVAYMIRELYYNRTPIFHSNGEQRRDYIFVNDLIDLALAVKDSKGFDIVNVSSNKSYSVKEMYDIVKKIMGKDIEADYANDKHYWGKYPELFSGEYVIKDSVLNHEINKYTLCDNSYAMKQYGWKPKVDIEEGLKILVEEQCKLLHSLEG